MRVYTEGSGTHPGRTNPEEVRTLTTDKQTEWMQETGRLVGRNTGTDPVMKHTRMWRTSQYFQDGREDKDLAIKWPLVSS